MDISQKVDERILYNLEGFRAGWKPLNFYRIALVKVGS